MSVIIDAIKRISIVAERQNWANMPGYIRAICEPYPPKKKVVPEELNEELIEIVSYRCDFKPRLTFKEIEEITTPYRYSLPQEILDLYQIGNGCLPIGDSEDRDWDSIYNYSYFPSMRNWLIPLSKAMSIYDLVLIEANPQLLPICYYGEERALYVLGGTEFRETAPLIWTYDEEVSDDIARMQVLWPSLSNMMLAYAERWEAYYDGSLSKSKKEEIYQKYSNGDEDGWLHFECI